MVVLAGAPKVKVELGADVVTGAPKAGGAGAPVVDDSKVGAELDDVLGKSCSLGFVDKNEIKSLKLSVEVSCNSDNEVRSMSAPISSHGI